MSPDMNGTCECNELNRRDDKPMYICENTEKVTIHLLKYGFNSYIKSSLSNFLIIDTKEMELRSLDGIDGTLKLITKWDYIPLTLDTVFEMFQPVVEEMTMTQVIAELKRPIKIIEG